MLLNTDKTKVMLLTSRQKRTTFTGKVLSLTFNNVELQHSADYISFPLGSLDPMWYI